MSDDKPSDEFEQAYAKYSADVEMLELFGQSAHYLIMMAQERIAMRRQELQAVCPHYEVIESTDTDGGEQRTCRLCHKALEATTETPS